MDALSAHYSTRLLGQGLLSGLLCLEQVLHQLPQDDQNLEPGRAAGPLQAATGEQLPQESLWERLLSNDQQDNCSLNHELTDFNIQTA